MRTNFFPMALMLMSLMTPVQTMNAATPSFATAADSDNILLLLKKPNNDCSNNTNTPSKGGRKKINVGICYSSIEAIIHNGVLILNNYSDIYDAEICICDEHGDIVVSSIIDIIADDDNTIDISSISSGYYTLYVTIDGVEYYSTFEM